MNPKHTAVWDNQKREMQNVVKACFGLFEEVSGELKNL